VRIAPLPLLTFLALPALLAIREAPAQDLAIVGATVIPMDGSRPIPDATVIVRGDRIVAVGPRDSLEVGDAEVIDGSGRWLIPGLWDMHVHALFDPALVDRLLALFVANGVTGIRDMGGRLDVLDDVRARVRTGALLAPRIVAAGPILDGPEAVHPEVSWTIETAEEGRQAVDSLAVAGVDFVKVYSMLPREAFLAIAERARERGLPVAGHVPLSVTPIEGARAGMKSIEHLRTELEPYCSRRDPAACDEPFAVFRELGTWQTPTLLVRRNRAFLDDSTTLWSAEMRYAPKALIDEWRAERSGRLERGEEYFAAAREHHAEERFVTGKLHQAGIPILAGSDAGVTFSLHGFSLHEEMELLVESGLKPEDALQAATSDAARFLGAADSLGTIAPGKKADLVLLDGDPLADISNTRRIHAVVINGRLLTRADLDHLLAGD
jgi:imidazolonepropionase-like amidohydrolase